MKVGAAKMAMTEGADEAEEMIEGRWHAGPERRWTNELNTRVNARTEV